MKKISLLTLILCYQICLGWGQNGHRIVAQICYDNLSEKAKREIDSILGDEYLTQVRKKLGLYKTLALYNY